uniref:PPM-type phosphatase domain-containing protein n=1 Tax=Hucho hucho TaxID=62062 RepID=A0A4W5QAY7_9TELE
MPLHSFGDVRFKWIRELRQSVLESLESGADLNSLNLYQYNLPNYLSPPYLDMMPQLTYHRLQPQDRFLILVSDGLWDEMTTEEAVRMVEGSSLPD